MSAEDSLLPRPNTDSNDSEPIAPLSNMGVSLSTARILAPLSFAVDFACQIYGMNSTPNMKTIHDRHLCAFSPQPYAIALFFGPQQLVQLAWLRELYRPDAQVEKATLRYVPWYALGNFCIALWMFLWNGDDLKGSNVPVTINTLTQLYHMIALRNPNPITWQSKLTNIVNITFAGVGVLDLFHNTAAAYFTGVRPNALVAIATAIAAPLTALTSPLLFGASIAYDLFGVSVGQYQIAQKIIVGGTDKNWPALLGGLGLGVSALVGWRASLGAKWL